MLGMSMDFSKLWASGMDNNFELSKTQTTQKNLSQEAIDKMIYDVLSGDGGLAALGSGENLVGGSKSSSKTLLAQDMMAKIIGELAKVTAPETTTFDEVKTTKEGRLMSRFGDFGDQNNVFNGGNFGDPGNLDGNTATVICTELNRLGFLSDELYQAGGPPSRQVSYYTWAGYYAWAKHVVPHISKNPVLCKVLLYIVVARYQHILGLRFSFVGICTTSVGHLICNIIGRVISLGETCGRIKHS